MAEEDWRARLRLAVVRSGKKRSTIAQDAGITPETLSRVLNAVHASPSFDTVVRIVHACGHSVGWLLRERGYRFAPGDLKRLRDAARIIDDLTAEDSE